jgi:hypothetical protein
MGGGHWVYSGIASATVATTSTIKVQRDYDCLDREYQTYDETARFSGLFRRLRMNSHYADAWKQGGSTPA